MSHKPDIVKYEPVPEATYLSVIKDWKMVDKRKDFLEKEKVEWAEKHPNLDFPTFKNYQYQFTFTVIEGEYAGEGLPSRYTTIRLSTDERNGLYKLLKAIYGIEGKYESLKARIEAGDAPDFDTEVKGKPVNVLIIIRDDGKNGIDAVSKVSKQQYESADALLVKLGYELVGEVTASETPDLGGDEIPF